MPVTIPKLMNADSSVVMAYSYSPEITTLYVRFKNGDVWAYSGLSVDAYQTFVAAPSIGSHFIRHIKNNYVQEKLADYVEE